MSQNEQMTYKQAIKILSEVKVADLPYNGCRGNQKAWDIGRRMAIQALKEKEQAETANHNANIPDLNMDFYTAWKFLSNHKMFNGLFECGLWTEVVKVNPETNEVDDDRAKNTKVQVWLEHGPYDKEWGSTTHDIDLDCGGDTFEEAIVKLASLVKKSYTDEGQRSCE